MARVASTQELACLSNVGHGELSSRLLQGDKTLVVRGQTLKQVSTTSCGQARATTGRASPRSAHPAEIRDSLQSLIRDEKPFWRRGQKGPAQGRPGATGQRPHARRTERMVASAATPRQGPIRRAAKRRIVRWLPPVDCRIWLGLCETLTIVSARWSTKIYLDFWFRFFTFRPLFRHTTLQITYTSSKRLPCTQR